ncbi:MAG: methyltransferase domain-containing protein [Actinomycetota bacterium]|nr:methyltransferase domain-containing protein [Actinomycetota bacterium]
MTGDRVVAVAKAAYRGVRWFSDATFDHWYGVRTRALGESRRGAPTIGDRVGYEPAGWLNLRRILSPREVDEGDIFLDLGSGMGRVVLQAARYPFRRVIGVEVSVDLHEAARENVARSREKLRCRDVVLVRSDVMDYPVPDDVTVVFLYNPFRGETFAQAVDAVLASVDRNPRRMRIVYVNPCEEQALLGTGRVRLVRTALGSRGTTRLYAVEP